MAKILIFGATSAIATAAARCFATRNDHLFLVARNIDQLSVIKQDLTIRGAASVTTRTSDLTQTNQHPSLYQQATQAMSGLDTVLIAHGTLPDQTHCQTNIEETLQAFSSNCLSYLSLLSLAANYFENQQRGTLVAITSVAGDRGRKSNYVYGSAKAAVNAYLEGLRHRLYASNVKVITIKPGFVDTPMTAEFVKNWLWASPEQVGRGLVDALDRQKDVVYLPGFWRWIMWVINKLPYPVFKRMNF